MISLRKKYQIFIIVVIILVSIYSGLKRSDFIMRYFGSNSKIDPDFIVAEKLFSEREKHIGYRVRFTSYDLPGLADTLHAILSESIEPIFSKEDIADGHLLYIVEIPVENWPSVESTISDIHSLHSINRIKLDQPKWNEVQKELPREIAIEDTLLATLKQELLNVIPNNPTDSQLDRLNRQIKLHESKRDSLRQFYNEQEQLHKNHLVYIQASSVKQPENVTQNIVGFLSSFFQSLAILIVLFLLISFTINLVLRLMRYFGIHTSKLRGGYSYKGYGSYYSYGGYGGTYGYGRKSKRKRIYKNADGTRKEVKDDKKNEEE